MVVKQYEQGTLMGLVVLRERRWEGPVFALGVRDFCLGASRFALWGSRVLWWREEGEVKLLVEWVSESIAYRGMSLGDSVSVNIAVLVGFQVGESLFEVVVVTLLVFLVVHLTG